MYALQDSFIMYSARYASTTKHAPAAALLACSRPTQPHWHAAAAAHISVVYKQVVASDPGSSLTWLLRQLLIHRFQTTTWL
jgi:hypothetical protein